MDDYKVNEPLPLKGTRNVRELGGYPTEDGKTTKDKVFLRADNLKKLTKKGRNYLYDYGVRLVIDLRSEAEIKRGADKIDTKQMEYVNYPLFDKVQSTLLKGNLPKNMSDMYTELVENSKDTLAAIFRRLIACKGCALFHCTAGKDRTGILAMMILKEAKVPDEVIIADYSVSGEHMKKVFDRQKWWAKFAGITIPDYIFESRPEYIKDLMDYLTKTYGSVHGYLREIGLKEEELTALRDKLV